MNIFRESRLKMRPEAQAPKARPGMEILNSVPKVSLPPFQTLKKHLAGSTFKAIQLPNGSPSYEIDRTIPPNSPQEKAVLEEIIRIFSNATPSNPQRALVKETEQRQQYSLGYYQARLNAPSNYYGRILRPNSSAEKYYGDYNNNNKNSRPGSGTMNCTNIVPVNAISGNVGPWAPHPYAIRPRVTGNEQRASLLMDKIAAGLSAVRLTDGIPGLELLANGPIVQKPRRVVAARWKRGTGKVGLDTKLLALMGDQGGARVSPAGVRAGAVRKLVRDSFPYPPTLDDPGLPCQVGTVSTSGVNKGHTVRQQELGGILGVMMLNETRPGLFMEAPTGLPTTPFPLLSTSFPNLDQILGEKYLSSVMSQDEQRRKRGQLPKCLRRIQVCLKIGEKCHFIRNPRASTIPSTEECLLVMQRGNLLNIKDVRKHCNGLYKKMNNYYEQVKRRLRDVPVGSIRRSQVHLPNIQNPQFYSPKYPLGIVQSNRRTRGPPKVDPYPPSPNYYNYHQPQRESPYPRPPNSFDRGLSTWSRMGKKSAKFPEFDTVQRFRENQNYDYQF